jgi:hypothetical protein
VHGLARAVTAMSVGPILAYFRELDEYKVETENVSVI